MNMTKEYLDGKIDIMSYSLDFPKRCPKAKREGHDSCELIECLYEEGIGRFKELCDGEFKTDPQTVDL